jgi:hypothetical protein
VEEVVHERFDPAGPIEADGAALAGRQRPYVGHARLADHVGHRLRAFGIDHVERQLQRRLRRQPDVGRDRSEVVHQPEPIAGREVTAVVVQPIGDVAHRSVARGWQQSVGGGDTRVDDRQVAGGVGPRKRDIALLVEQQRTLGDLAGDQALELR